MLDNDVLVNSKLGIDIYRPMLPHPPFFYFFFSDGVEINFL